VIFYVNTIHMHVKPERRQEREGRWKHEEADEEVKVQLERKDRLIADYQYRWRIRSLGSYNRKY